MAKITHKKYNDLKIPNLLLDLVDDKKRFRGMLCSFVSDYWRDKNCNDEDGDINCSQCLLAENNVHVFANWLKPNADDDDGDKLQSIK